ncbi:MAG: transketolase C-terminal domain-containing protein [Clostridia bacterium]
MSRFEFLNGNEALAWGVKLAKPGVIAAYPITPQTIAVEKIAEFVQDGLLDSIYLHVESEHSAMACSIGASATGVRTFTATSSQGLLYMAECLPYASGARLPIVMMNANRAMATPWNIYGDQMDVMYVLNSGWIQLFAENAQEALDMVIQSFKLAEDSEVMAPVMINLDGFVLTHTYEKVNIPEQELVDSFLPPMQLQSHMMNAQHPTSVCISAGNAHNMEFKLKQHLDLLNAIAVFSRISKEFGNFFGRYHGGAVEGYYYSDADVLLVTVGSIAGTVKEVVDAMRKEGHSVGLLKLRMVRPFPVKQLAEACKNAIAVGVLDKNISFGYEGTIYTNVNSALLQSGVFVKTQNFIGGLGGRDIPKKEIRSMFKVLLDNLEEKKVRFHNLRCT